MAFLQGTVPYQQFVKGQTDSLTDDLKQKGYTTVALHPYGRYGYSRDKVYPALGFDEYLDQTSFENPELERDWCVTDEESYKKVIEIFEKTEIILMIWDVLIDRKGVNRIQTELLLRKVQSGDTGALDTLITAYYPQILNYCRWHTADEQQAQDAAQETFLKAVRWLDSCGGFQGAFRPFLYKIAKNICIDLNRTMERMEVSLESLPGEPAYQESGFAAAEEKANLRALTAQLEPEQRELVLLRFAQQLKLREIAQITGLPLRTVQSRLRAALKTLKMQLEKEDWR